MQDNQIKSRERENNRFGPTDEASRKYSTYA